MNFYALYGVMDRLAAHLQESSSACEYMSDRCRKVIRSLTQAWAELSEVTVVGMARSALAAHATRRALEQL